MDASLKRVLGDYRISLGRWQAAMPLDRVRYCLFSSVRHPNTRETGIPGSGRYATELDWRLETGNARVLYFLASRLRVLILHHARVFPGMSGITRQDDTVCVKVDQEDG